MFQPINKYIVVQKIEEELKTESGLILSQEDAKNFRYAKANVVRVGSNVEVINDGDLIYYDKSIVVQKIEEELKTESGLILSQEDAKNFRYAKANVVRVGSNVEVINDGDLIYYDKSAGHSMLISDNPYTIILERDVVVVLD
jgi:co-chaperonin GroES (HSP10)